MGDDADVGFIEGFGINIWKRGLGFGIGGTGRGGEKLWRAYSISATT